MHIIEEVRKLDLTPGEYVVIGGGCLAIRGLRETRDLDIVVLPRLFETLHAQGWPLDPVYERKWNRRRLNRGDIEIYPDMYLERENAFLDVHELIRSAEIIDGVPFMRLEALRLCKMDAGREKDLADVAMIDKILLHAPRR